MSFDPTSVLIVIAAAFCSSIIGALSGVGGGMLVMPFLVPVVGVKGVVPVMAIAMFIANFSRVWVYRSDIDKPLLARLVLAIVPGVVIGTFIYNWLPERAVAVIVGVFLIASIALRRWLSGKTIDPGPRGTPAIGFAFGVMTGSTPGAGILMVALLLGMGLGGTTLIATDAVIGMLAAFIKSVMFSSFSLLDLEGLLLGLAIGVVTVPGAYAARWLVNNLAAAIHVWIIEAMIFFAGASFLWRAYTL
ncbi:MAG: hypothetical protein RLZ98_2 [Pseudomonadota bacterium]|jgi:uncharacterized membrane protein YfcA